MRLDKSSKFIGLLSGMAIILASGCASQGSVSEGAPDADAAQVSIPADTSVPAVPVTAETVVPVEEKKAPEEPAKPGSVASVLKKMDENPFTLYWREKDAYSYHIGNVLDAEYKPGHGLIVKSQAPENAVTCEFNEQGELVNVNTKEGGEDQCSKLMFTLDQDLDSSE